MTQLDPSDSQRQILGPGQVVSREKLKSLSSNSPLHKRILVVDNISDIAFTLRIGLEDPDPTMTVHSFDNLVTSLLEFKPDFYDC